MADLILNCQDCAVEVGSSAVREFRCLDCHIDRAVAPFTDDYIRLLRKERRYSRLAANLTPLRRQLDRAEVRIARTISAEVSSVAAAAEQAQRTQRRLRALAHPLSI